LEDSPSYKPFIANNLARWNICPAVNEGVLQRSTGGEPIRDFGTGWYDYAAQGFRHWGLAVPSREPPSGSTMVELYGVEFPIEDEAERSEPLITLPLALLGLESGWRSPEGGRLTQEEELFDRLVQAQERRTMASGLLTARSNFRRSSAPYLLINAVLQQGYAWSTAEGDGRAYPELALTSTAAAFASDVMTSSASMSRARASLSTLFDPDRGWFEGRYELSGAHETNRTSLTNAVVLETLLRVNAGTPLPETLSNLSVAERRNPSGELECRLPALQSLASGPER
jgi:hypothetical protein